MHKLFKNCDFDFNKFLRIKNYKKNDIIFNEHSECTSVGLIIKGSIIINTYTYDEHDYNIITLTNDDCFGNNLIFSSHPYYLGDLICTKETTIAFINKTNLIYLLQSSKEFLFNYMAELTDKSIRIQNKVKVLSQKTIRDKIMFYLLEKYKETNNRKIIIPNKEKLAIYLNIPRPSLSRELINLKKDNIITYTRNYIEIKKA